MVEDSSILHKEDIIILRLHHYDDTTIRSRNFLRRELSKPIFGGRHNVTPPTIHNARWTLSVDEPMPHNVVR